jgi:hypothetical protein
MMETHSNKPDERRFTERFKLPDGLIYYRQLRKINIFNSFQGPFVLDDIASNSASFECSNILKIKKHLELKITSPGAEKEIFVKGQITRTDSHTKSGEIKYIVQFNPFGKGLIYNTSTSKETMRAFIKSVQSLNNV